MQAAFSRAYNVSCDMGNGDDNLNEGHSPKVLEKTSLARVRCYLMPQENDTLEESQNMEYRV